MLAELRAMAARAQGQRSAAVVAKTTFGPDGGYVRIEELIAWARPADPAARPIVAGERVRLVDVDESNRVLVVAGDDGYGGRVA